MKGIEITRNDHCIRLPPACVLNRLAEKSEQQVFAMGVGKFLIAFLAGVTFGVFSGLLFKSIALGTIIGVLIAYLVLEIRL